MGEATGRARPPLCQDIADALKGRMDTRGDPWVSPQDGLDAQEKLEDHLDACAAIDLARVETIQGLKSCLSDGDWEPCGECLMCYRDEIDRMISERKGLKAELSDLAEAVTALKRVALEAMYEFSDHTSKEPWAVETDYCRALLRDLHEHNLIHYDDERWFMALSNEDE